MKQSYELPEPDEAVQALAWKLVDDLVAAGTTFRKSLDALEEAQKILERETKPVKAVSTCP